jgi:MFS family permease
LLLAPQGIGAMITMPIAGMLADRIGVRKVALPGLALIIAGMVVFTQVEADTPYWLLLSALGVLGLGMGATMMPIMSAALRTLTNRTVARASTSLNIIQQTSGAIGGAVMSIILAALLAGQFGVPTAQGQFAASVALSNPATRDQAAVLVADSFASTFLWALILIAVCVVPALFLPGARQTVSSAPSEDGDQEEDKDAKPVMLGH